MNHEIAIIDQILDALRDDISVTSKEDFHKLKNRILAQSRIAE